MSEEGRSGTVSQIDQMMEKIKRLNQELSKLEIAIQSEGELIQDLDLENAIVDRIVELARWEIDGLEDNEDMQADSHTLSSGMGFRWIRNFVPVGKLPGYQVWLLYTSGFNLVAYADAPYRVSDFLLYVKEVEEEDE